MIIVTGGEGEGYNYLTSVEVLSPTGVRLPCSVPLLPSAQSPFSRYHHTQDGAVACGGYYYEDATNCRTLTASGWTKSHDLIYQRRRHVSWNSPDGLLLMGGDYSYRTTELLANTSTSRRMSNRDHTESPYQTSTSSFDLDYDIS